MLNVQELKQKACAVIEQHKAEIIGLATDILAHPEAGFTETRTSRLVAQKFGELGIQHREGLAITGIKARIQGGAGSGPRVALLGELDSLLVTEHPYADSETGAAHACGHHCQIGMMLGATMGLTHAGGIGPAIRGDHPLCRPSRRVHRRGAPVGTSSGGPSRVFGRQAGADPLG